MRARHIREREVVFEWEVEAAQNTLMVKIPCQALDRAGAGSGSSSVSAANGRCLIGRTETYVIDFGLGYINSHLVVTVGSLLDSLLLCSRMNSTSET